MLVEYKTGAIGFEINGDFMDNQEFSALLKLNFADLSKHTFLKRATLIDSEEENLPESVSQLVVADIKNDDLDIKSETGGTFEFISRTYPNIKTGVTLRNTKDDTLTSVAENLAIGCKHRLNALLTLYMYGEGSMGSFYLKSEAPEGIHSEIVSNHRPISDILNHKELIESVYRVKYDRITLNSKLLSAYTGSEKSVEAKKILKAETGLKVDVVDGFYKERGIGEFVTNYYVPENKFILSNSKDDKTNKFYFANLPITGEEEPEVRGEYGITGYIRDNTAWAIVRGVPILKDKTLFSTVTYKRK